MKVQIRNAKEMPVSDIGILSSKIISKSWFFVEDLYKFCSFVLFALYFSSFYDDRTSFYDAFRVFYNWRYIYNLIYFKIAEKSDKYLIYLCFSVSMKHFPIVWNEKEGTYIDICDFFWEKGAKFEFCQAKYWQLDLWIFNALIRCLNKVVQFLIPKFIRKRMKSAGSRRTENNVQNMISLRVLRANGDCESYRKKADRIWKVTLLIQSDQWKEIFQCATSVKEFWWLHSCCHSWLLWWQAQVWQIRMIIPLVCGSVLPNWGKII